MPYYPTIHQEEQDVAGLGDDATRQDLAAMYNAIICHWFPTDDGLDFILRLQILHLW
jgi:hypothetical protein